jgi:hypothetical protein
MIAKPTRIKAFEKRGISKTLPFRKGGKSVWPKTPWLAFPRERV